MFNKNGVLFSQDKLAKGAAIREKAERIEECAKEIDKTIAGLEMTAAEVLATFDFLIRNYQAKAFNSYKITNEENTGQTEAVS